MPGVIALFGTFLIMIILLAVLALIVVKALAEARGACSRLRDHPYRDLDGRLHALHPAGRDRRSLVIGFVLLLLAFVYGQRVADDPGRRLFHLHRDELAGCYRLRLLASVLPFGSCSRRAIISPPS